MPPQEHFVAWVGGHGNSSPHPSTLARGADPTRSKAVVAILDALTETRIGQASTEVRTVLLGHFEALKTHWEPFVNHGGNHFLMDHKAWLDHKKLSDKPLPPAFAASPFFFGSTTPYEHKGILAPAILDKLNKDGYVSFGPSDFVGSTPALVEGFDAKVQELFDESIDHFSYLIFTQNKLPIPADPTSVMISRAHAGKVCGEPLIMMKKKPDGTFHTNAQGGLTRASTSMGVGPVTQDAVGPAFLDMALGDDTLCRIWHDLQGERSYFMTDRFRVKRTSANATELPIHYDIPITSLLPHLSTR